MKRLGLTLTLLCGLMGSMIAQDSLFVSGIVNNLMGAVIELEITLNDGQTASVITNGDGTFETAFPIITTNFGTATATYTDCNGDVVSITNGWSPNLLEVYFDINYCSNTGGDIYGCTDPDALNYNPAATIDDGSCVYDNGCECDSTLYEPVCAITQPSGNLFGDTLTFPNSCFAACEGATVIYDGPCDDIVNSIFGCTDPDALNYNPNATIDDGSCVYDNTGEDPCNASFIAFADSSGANTIWVVNTSSGENLEYLWEFGDGSTSTEQFPVYTYDGDGPYNLCLTVTSGTPNGGLMCTSTYCEEISADMFEGVQSQGFQLNVIESIAASIDEVELISSFDTYPNPVTSTLTIEFESQVNSNGQLQIVDLAGHLVFDQSVKLIAGHNKNVLTLDNLQNGIYLVVLRTDAVAVQQRIVKF